MRGSGAPKAAVWVAAVACAATLGCERHRPAVPEMEFVRIEPGTFVMGSPFAETGRYDDEAPRHEVTISRGFWLGKYEVTQAQWLAVMGRNYSEPRGSCCMNMPVNKASWGDVQEFLRKLNQAAGRELYRLPTEAEWEYACRAATTTPWSFGDDPSQLGEFAWWGGNSGSRNAAAQEVGRKKPNAWGLHDMHGNVWEWVQDRYGLYSGKAQVDPTGPAWAPAYAYDDPKMSRGGTPSHRVARGGSYGQADASQLRSAFRVFVHPLERSRDLGFRLVKMEP
jgi:formylglycine-generating enzyme required for sulfatase activity